MWVTQAGHDVEKSDVHGPCRHPFRKGEHFVGAVMSAPIVREMIWSVREVCALQEE